jgi:superfamily II DNA/RNA helicase
LQGNLSQNARERVMADFRAGRVPILLATNVAARGLDVQDVDTVINYELPESAEWFTHRVGRTGRMGRSGQAITFLTADDAGKWREIERHLGRKLRRQTWGETRVVPAPLVRQRVDAPVSRPQSTSRSPIPARAQAGARPQLPARAQPAGGAASPTGSRPPRRRRKSAWDQAPRTRAGAFA